MQNFWLWNGQDKIAKLESLERFSVLALLFFIPISPAITSLLGVVLIVLWLLKGQYAAGWQKIVEQPIAWPFIAYFLLYPLSLLWTENLVWGVHVAERHMLYLLFPFMLMAVKKADLKYYLTAFIFGITFTEMVSYLMWFDVIYLADVSHQNEPVPFYHHVEYNPMLAWGIYLLMHGLFFEKHSLKLKAFFAIFVVTMTVNMFITGGRGGQLTYFVIVGLLFIQYFHAKQQLLKGVLLATGFVAIVFISAYQTSSLFQQRVNEAVTEIENFSPSSAGSVASRLHMYQNTFNMAFDRSWDKVILGSGVGDFPEDYNRYAGDEAVIQLTANKTGHAHPHNMYLYQLGALGLVGLGSLLWLFVGLAQQARKLNDDYNHHRVALVVFFMIINLTDSLFLSHPISVLFIAFSVLLFVQPVQKSD